MKLLIPILSLLLAGCASSQRPEAGSQRPEARGPTSDLRPPTSSAQADFDSQTSDLSPLTSVVPTAPVLIWLAPPPSELQIVWPNDFTRTNYNWWFEVADEPIGPWRYPDEPQFPDDTNWIIHLDGAHFIRLQGTPN